MGELKKGGGIETRENNGEARSDVKSFLLLRKSVENGTGKESR